jgi:hypothetical protein
MSSVRTKLVAALLALPMVASLPLSCEMLMFSKMACGYQMGFADVSNTAAHDCCPDGNMPCCKVSSGTDNRVVLQLPESNQLSLPVNAVAYAYPVPVLVRITTLPINDNGIPPVLSQKEDFRT